MIVPVLEHFNILAALPLDRPLSFLRTKKGQNQLLIATYIRADRRPRCLQIEVLEDTDGA